MRNIEKKLILKNGKRKITKGEKPLKKEFFL